MVSTIIEEAALFSQVKAFCARRVKGEPRRTNASEATITVDTGPSLADAGIEETLVDVKASLSIGLSTASRTVTVLVSARLARRSPSFSDGAAALRLERQ